MNLLQQIFLLENLSKTETVRKEREYRKEESKDFINKYIFRIKQFKSRTSKK